MSGTVSSIESRIWSKVEPTGFCWNWTAAKGELGYGYIAKPGGGNAMAHRAVYELLVGPIPKGLVLDHLCRNPSCVNPDHLEPVTQEENCRRGFGFGGLNIRKTHCVEGHAYDEANTYVTTEGWRQCKECRSEKGYTKDERREYMRAYRAKNRADPEYRAKELSYSRAYEAEKRNR